MQRSLSNCTDFKASFYHHFWNLRFYLVVITWSTKLIFFIPNLPIDDLPIAQVLFGNTKIGYMHQHMYMLSLEHDTYIYILMYTQNTYLNYGAFLFVNYSLISFFSFILYLTHPMITSTSWPTLKTKRTTWNYCVSDPFSTCKTL